MQKIFSLYFLNDDGSEDGYGTGNLEYIVELLDDFIRVNEMYSRKNTSFVVKMHEK